MCSPGGRHAQSSKMGRGSWGPARPALDERKILRYSSTLDQWYLGTIVPDCHGTMVPWYHGTMVPWYHSAMVPLYNGTMYQVRWFHGTMVPWFHGTMVPWYYGTMVFFSYNHLKWGVGSQCLKWRGDSSCGGVVPLASKIGGVVLGVYENPIHSVTCQDGFLDPVLLWCDVWDSAKARLDMMIFRGCPLGLCFFFCRFDDACWVFFCS